MDITVTKPDDKFPPDLPPAPHKPLPKGSIVTGYTHSGIFGFPGHKLHGQFELLTKPHRTNRAHANMSNSGYLQDVLCITCGKEILMVDCEFLMTRATREEVQFTMRVITESRAQLLAARRYYNALVDEERVK